MTPLRHTIVLALACGLLFTLLSSHRLNAAPEDVHSWRQSLGLAVGRNFACGQPASLPRLDACGNGTHDGIVAMELPAYAYAGALLGRATNAWTGARLVAFLSAALAIVGLGLLSFRVLNRTGDPLATTLGAAFAGAAYLWSPVGLHWMGSLMPDGVAWGLTLFGAGVAVNLRAGKTTALAMASLVCGLGVATKLISGPVLAASTLLVLGNALEYGLGRRRSLLVASMHGVLALLPAALWYLVRNPQLAAIGNDCRLFLLATEESLWSALRRGVALRVLRGHLDAATGSLTLLVLVGAPLTVVLGRWRALPMWLSGLASFAVVASLGWHARVHEYDALAYVPLIGLCAGSAVAGFVLLLRSWTRDRRRSNEHGSTPTVEKWSAVASVAVVVPLLGYGLVTGQRGALDRQAREADPQFLTAAQLELVLPDQEVFQLAREPWDPRLSYFAGRRVHRLEDHGPLCDVGVAPEHDCVAVNKPPGESPGCRPRRTLLPVALEHVQLYCGLLDPRNASERKRHLARLLHGSPEGAPLPGLGTVMGVAVHASYGATRVDVVLDVRNPAALPKGFELQSGGGRLEIPVPDRLRRSPPGVVLVGVPVPRRTLDVWLGDVRLSDVQLRDTKASVSSASERPSIGTRSVLVGDSEPLAFRCAGPPTPR